MKSRIDDGSGLGLGALLISRNGLRKGALRKCAPLPGIHSGKVAGLCRAFNRKELDFSYVFRLWPFRTLFGFKCHLVSLG